MNFDENSRLPKDMEDNANSAVILQQLIMHKNLATMTEPGMKASFLGGMAIMPLSGLAILFSDHRQYNKESNVNPTADNVMFGALYTIVAIEDHPNGLIAGFDILYIEKAKELYRKITGREYKNLAPAIEEAIRDRLASGNNVPESMKKFVPNK